MSQNSYPFIKCLKPRRIINPYTRESIVVECGCCPACSLRKSSLSALRVKLESLSHKYTMFITLTYNNDSLPRMIVKATNRFLDDCGEVHDTNEQFCLVDITHRLGTQGTILGRTSDYYMCTEVYNKKCNTPSGILPHLSKYDCQLFIKRLRKNIQVRFPNETPKIRYYLVGEYGPVHFRPHYHVILWFEEKELFARIRQIIRKSWSFGRIDCQKSLNKCADYVAKYLNSSVSLPNVFKERSIRPFAIHSSHLGEKVFEATREEIYENEFERVIKRSIPYINTDSEIVMWRSLKNFYFPKCKGYVTKSESERMFSYSTYVKAYRWLGETCVSAQARTIVACILYRFYHIDMADDLYYYDDELIDYFERSSLFDPYSFEHKSFKDHVDDVYRRVYMELRLSKHFHRFVCKGFINLYKPMYNKIVEFWNKSDYLNLKNQLDSQIDFVMSDFFENNEDFQYFYYNNGFCIDKFKETKSFNLFNTVTVINSERAVKHKCLNDMNKIFCDN